MSESDKEIGEAHGFHLTPIAAIIIVMAWVILFAFVRAAFAHDVDLLCRPDQATEDGCQENTPGMGLDNPEFFKAHKSYWHCRRELVVEDIVGIAQCVGERRGLRVALGEPDVLTESEAALLSYWKIWPTTYSAAGPCAFRIFLCCFSTYA